MIDSSSHVLIIGLNYKTIRLKRSVDIYLKYITEITGYILTLNKISKAPIFFIETHRIYNE